MKGTFDVYLFISTYLRYKGMYVCEFTGVDLGSCVSPIDYVGQRRDGSVFGF